MLIRMQTLGARIGKAALHSIGASCYLFMIGVQGATHTYMIDCGMDTAQNEDAIPWWQPPIDLLLLQQVPRIDMIFATHAHRDHIAGLCLQEITERLAEQAKIICTRPTGAFLPLVLHDETNVAGKRNNKEKSYLARDINALVGRIEKVMEPGVIELVPNAISVLVWPSGHIRGACSFIFLIQEGKKRVKIMFSGDYATHAQIGTLGAPLPPKKWMPDIIAAFDCTKGGARFHSWNHEMKRFTHDSKKAVQSGGAFFAFAAAMDRAPSIAQHLVRNNIPVYMDGASAIQCAHVMYSDEGAWCNRDRPTLFENVELCEYVGEALVSSRPRAIIAPSALGFGPAAKYLLELLPRENAWIATPGFVSRGSNGYRALHAQQGDQISLEVNGKITKVAVNARCEQYHLTAHSEPQSAIKRIHQLIGTSCFLKSFDQPLIGLSHGSTSALDWFEDMLSNIKTFRSDRIADRDIVLVD